MFMCHSNDTHFNVAEKKGGRETAWLSLNNWAMYTRQL